MALWDSDSLLCVRNVFYDGKDMPWYRYIEKKGTADEFCRKLGVSAIVFAHDPQDDVVNVGNRIFGIDILMQKKAHRDSLAYHQAGIYYLYSDH